MRQAGKKRRRSAAVLRAKQLVVLRLLWRQGQALTFEVQQTLGCCEALTSEVVSPLKRQGFILAKMETDEEMRHRVVISGGPSRRQAVMKLNRNRVREVFQE